MVRAAKVLEAATRTTAEVLGIGGDTGTLEKGKRADLIVLDADPLRDISNTKKIHQVWVNGRLVD